jgi:hypothetical protein
MERRTSIQLFEKLCWNLQRLAAIANRLRQMEVHSLLRLLLVRDVRDVLWRRPQDSARHSLEAKATHDCVMGSPRPQDIFRQFLYPSLLGSEKSKIKPTTLGAIRYSAG